MRCPATSRATSPDLRVHWVWQRGPWLLVDRVTGHIVALKLPDYDPGVSQVSWFRDYGAYCGVTASGKSLYAVVAQVAARKPVLAKKLAAFDPENHSGPGLRPRRVAARAAARHLSSHRQGCGELRRCSRLGGAGGGRGRRAGDSREGCVEEEADGSWVAVGCAGMGF
jgi:hypothetical protein